jgi:hypothetical protein
MASKILSFICHVPSAVPGSYPAVPTHSASPKSQAAERRTEGVPKGHFTAIYENDKFVRFKYISNE